MEKHDSDSRGPNIVTGPDGLVTATYKGQTITANRAQSDIIVGYLVDMFDNLIQPKLCPLLPDDPMYFLFLRTKIVSYDTSRTLADDVWGDELIYYCYVLDIDNVKFVVKSSYHSGHSRFCLDGNGKKLISASDGSYPDYYQSNVTNIMNILNISPDLLDDFLMFFPDITGLGGRSFRSHFVACSSDQLSP